MNEHIVDRPKVGDTLCCTETGKAFTVTSDGCVSNYATNAQGQYFSDDGVVRCDRRRLLDRTRPVLAYMAQDGGSVTGWKGNYLGEIVQSTVVPLTCRSHTHGKYIQAVRIRDIHGAYWYGRGSPSLAIVLRPMKTPRRVY